MDVENAFLQTCLAGSLGLCASFCSELLLKPRPVFFRPLSSWLAHFGLWALVYGIFTLILGRPWCAMCAVLALIFILVIVNNAKYKSLREPFLFQDYDYFLDTIRFPRLFLPFLGLKSFCVAVAFCCAAVLGMMWEQPPPSRWSFYGLAGAAALFIILGAVALWLAARRQPNLSLEPEKDFRKLGFLPFLWAYGLKNCQMPDVSSPFAIPPPARKTGLPHLVAIQSESFFDARKLFSGIKPGILANLDALRDSSAQYGNLDVPAWGANTVRTECAFLTGLSPRDLGIRGFNPYHAMLAGWRPSAMPGYLRSLGYRTICVHPYYGAFYGRAKIFPRLGFDVFLDGRNFTKSGKSGPYVDDMELGVTILDILKKADQPVFIFAISMENHGPLHLEPVQPPTRLKEFFDILPPQGCKELGIYLNHLANADRMLGMLHNALINNVPSSLCFYGDHVPIMPVCYSLLGYPSGKVPYFYWNNINGINHGKQDLKVEDLASGWLESMDLFRLPGQASG